MLYEIENPLAKLKQEVTAIMTRITIIKCEKCDWRLLDVKSDTAKPNSNIVLCVKCQRCRHAQEIALQAA